MRILIVDDDQSTRRLVEHTLLAAGYEADLAEDGEAAWDALETGRHRIVLTDWLMSRLSGLELVERIRSQPDRPYTYLIMLTVREALPDLVEALDAGADDYLTKPFRPEELLARIRAGERTVDLHDRLAQRVGELEQALAEVKRLRGLLPICMICHKIRDDHQYWHRLEAYLSTHAGIEFTHGMCPDCAQKWREENGLG
ncbi:response regulator [Deferrisoma sp.]